MGDEDDEPVVDNLSVSEAPAAKKKEEGQQELDAALKPRVLETLDRIANDYVRLSEMQDLRMSATLNEDDSFSATAEGDYQQLRSEIVLLVNELHLHNNRIEAL